MVRKILLNELHGSAFELTSFLYAPILLKVNLVTYELNAVVNVKTKLVDHTGGWSGTVTTLEEIENEIGHHRTVEGSQSVTAKLLLKLNR